MRNKRTAAAQNAVRLLALAVERSQRGEHGKAAGALAAARGNIALASTPNG